ncbi:hypothetical protein BJ875DRAFT_484830 [Amylocarpus encephaloides]|uniref:SET domain-containing protein n=1 Tax=Amylocarpus encephaloides TaxID=45428 RepID=A0A9P8C4M3_9HELO|nr:hypothetical protein BJ875DRAFT_484830 [Amylocarpus encephaloides]
MSEAHVYPVLNEALTFIYESPGKGYGIFAAKEIIKGTRIINEVPLIRLATGASTFQDLQIAWEMVPHHRSHEVVNLSFTAHSEGPQQNLHWIFEQNAYNGVDERILVVKAARINHSCRPNAFGRINELTNAFTVQVFKDLRPGDEILMCYCQIEQNSLIRKEQLRPFNFECTCAICDISVVNHQFVHEANESRLELEGLRANLDALKAVGNLNHANIEQGLECVDRILELAEKESFIEWVIFACSFAADAFLRKGDREKALLWKMEEKKFVEQAYGLDTVEGNEVTKWLDKEGFRGTKYLWHVYSETSGQIDSRIMNFKPKRGVWRDVSD